MRWPLLILTLSGFLFSCTTKLYPLKADTSYYNISAATNPDSLVLQYIQPYHDSIEKDMNEIVATSAMVMEKGKPESLMGNFIADLLLEMGKQFNNDSADLCIVNYGGLRIPSLPAGQITTGKIFELMPFDNFLVIMQLKGSVVQQVFNLIAADGGWPIAGARFVIKDGTATQVLINSQQLENERIYNVVISDYLADGGDNLLFLRDENRKNLGIFLREIILEYLRNQTEQGKMISSSLDKRIVQ